MQKVTLPPQKVSINFQFCLFLVSAAAAEFWCVFHWWCYLKQHWLESARAGQLKSDLNLIKSARFGLECL